MKFEILQFFAFNVSSRVLAIFPSAFFHPLLCLLLYFHFYWHFIELVQSNYCLCLCYNAILLVGHQGAE